MRRSRPSLFLLPVTAAAVATFVAGVRVYMGRSSQDRAASTERVDIVALRAPLPAPSFLACPPDYCALASGTTVPIFPMPWRRLRDAWTAMIARQGRVVQVGDEEQGRRLIYIQHSLVFQFPDIVTVEFVPFGPDASSLAVFSRSRYGRSDFNQNRKRVEAWLTEVEKSSSPAPTTAAPAH
jgi:hypothetical protein